ncbi:MAG: hypothetical protein LKF37_06355 [Lentilactobacillus diolivorans]|nr:hypothetical protein [Lentilactobacillus diolivorans]MCH4164393.1 hypothetical protein [Lentilactobacillus diolivorans]RRG03366.1 MAG: hypothetical protein DUD34_05550 [Lactobacillus sp.]GEP23204.1 hypothetical protein LDI01_07970 [Lentilactobacillus diolivorans]
MKSRICRILCSSLMLISSIGLFTFSQGNLPTYSNTGVAVHAAVVNHNYDRSIKLGVNFIAHHTQKSLLNSWDALALSRSPQGLSRNQKTFFYNSLKRQFKSLKGNYAATDFEKTVIGLTAIGRNPKHFEGQSLVNDVIRTATKDGINGQAFGLIALSTNHYGKRSSVKINELIAKLLKSQNASGGWSLSGNKSDLDITGMVLQALGMHQNVVGVQSAINKAVRMLKTEAFEKKTGGFLIKSHFTKKENANAIASVVAGLAACRIDPIKSFKGVNHVNPISRLLLYQMKSGQFYWILKSHDGALNMSTQQSVYALEQYRFFKLNKGSIYDFSR